jgi:transcription factor IIIB 90 kDa subunit
VLAGGASRAGAVAAGERGEKHPLLVAPQLLHHNNHPSPAADMSSSTSFIKPTARQAQAAIKPKGNKRPNSVRMMRERNERQAAEAAAKAAANSSSTSLNVSTRPQCPNKSCTKPNVVDGVCQTCGRVADDSNIVAEVQFGETSSGAAVVQGSYIGADQAGVRSWGPAFRAGGIMEAREKTIREARSLITGFAQQLNLSDTLVSTGVNCFKLASDQNFVQGRTMISVAAVCLYAACRVMPPCRIMLIDLADLVQINVFKLGRIYKALLKTITLDQGAQVFAEDLIHRFAVRLEFAHATQKVAEDAVRLVQRMSRDWIVMGRRPAGICGACLLMAARMHNFRRTVREVVYVVKVTNHTIASRLEDFKQTETSGMSIEDFLKQDFLESAHDPPSFYKKSEEWKQKVAEQKSKKRKRKVTEDPDEESEVDGANTTTREQNAETATRQSVRTPDESPDRSVSEVIHASAGASGSSSTPGTGNQPNASPAGASPGPDLSSLPPVQYRRDRDGFVIPPKPVPADLEDGNNDFSVESAALLGNGEQVPDTGNGKQPRKRIPIDQAWENDENDLETVISEIMNDPETLEHAKAFSNAEQRAQLHSMWALQQRPLKDVSMSTEIEEDEFADDPEVQECVLSPDEVKLKEHTWVNKNRDWLRSQQEKIWRLRQAKDEPPKKTRKRRKKARIGEGQLTPASTPGEAAVNVMKERGFSTRINYDALRNMFDDEEVGPGSAVNSAGPSLAGSVFGDQNSPAVDDHDSVLDDEEDEEENHNEGEEHEGDRYDDNDDGDEFQANEEDFDGEPVRDPEYDMDGYDPNED